MKNRVQEFLKLTNLRNKKMKEHCKNQSWLEICNSQEENDWYTQTIAPIDEKIVAISNSIIAKFSIPCKKSKNIQDVYSNKWLLKVFNSNDLAKDENSLNK